MALPAKNNIVRQFIYIRLPVVWKILLQCITDIQNNFGNGFCKMFFLK